MDLYEEMQAVASNVLAEFGQGAGAADDQSKGLWYVALTPGSGPRDNPGPPVETLYKMDGAASGVKFKYVDGSDVIASDMQAVLAINPAVTPNIKGFVQADGIRYKVVKVMLIPPVGTPVVNVLIFRK